MWFNGCIPAPSWANVLPLPACPHSSPQNCPCANQALHLRSSTSGPPVALQFCPRSAVPIPGLAPESVFSVSAGAKCFGVVLVFHPPPPKKRRHFCPRLDASSHVCLKESTLGADIHLPAGVRRSVPVNYKTGEELDRRRTAQTKAKSPMRTALIARRMNGKKLCSGAGDGGGGRKRPCWGGGKGTARRFWRRQQRRW